VSLNLVVKIARWSIVFLAVTPGTCLAARQQDIAQAQEKPRIEQEATSEPNPSNNAQDENPVQSPQPRAARSGPDFLRIFGGGENASLANRGSPYVPLDSWIYPALERLTSMALADSGFAGMRPWTRAACAQMVAEAQDRIEQYPDQYPNQSKGGRERDRG